MIKEASEKTDVSNIGFLETMLEYYLPGLDASTLSEEQFINKMAWLLKIRGMEKEDNITNVLKNFL